MSLEETRVRQWSNFEKEDVIVTGLSSTGTSHIADGAACQDYHLIEELAPGWLFFAVSDGAGSASKSDVGSERTCLLLCDYVRQLLLYKHWVENDYTPSEIEWYIESRAIFSKLKLDFKRIAKEYGEEFSEKDFNSTILFMIVTPTAILSAHIGDGRMGYKDSEGLWHSLMKPHKGDEVNQTIFVQSNWTYPQSPALQLKSVYVPESSLISVHPSSVVLISDGCEMFAWECSIDNPETGVSEDVNRPFAGFLNPLLDDITNTPYDKRIDKLNTILSHANQLCEEETDDKTLLIAKFIDNIDSLGNNKSDKDTD